MLENQRCTHTHTQHSTLNDAEILRHTYLKQNPKIMCIGAEIETYNIQFITECFLYVYSISMTQEYAIRKQ